MLISHHFMIENYLIIIALINFVHMVSIINFGTHLICDRIPGLRPDQKRICREKPQSLPIIINGLRLASEECKRRFQYNRWNCSSLPGRNIFTHHMLRGSREAAYSHAIRSAAVTFAISESCSRGNISYCGCHQIDDNIRNDWKWSACNANIDFGVKLAKIFIDSEDYNRNSRSLMNLHNNNVGRKSVKDLLITRCKCHGVSGSCTARTCWKTLPSFTTIGDHLMKKYRSARRVALLIDGKSDSKPKFSLKLRKIVSNERQLQSLPKSRELVYLEKSVNYCDKNLLTDSLGTSGRTCNKSSDGNNGCDSLCCGRGYNTHRFIKKWKCRCVFRFCCSVNCQECSQPSEQYSCK